MGSKVRVPLFRGLARTRLQVLLDKLWDARLALVVAPAGSGKSTFLAQFADSAPHPVAWYRAEGSDGEVPVFLAHLESALISAIDGLPRGWDTVEDAARALDAWEGGPVLLVIDDLHTLEGTPAEEALERLLDYTPPWLAVLAGSRRAPSFNLSRRRVSGDLLEIGPDELRFRSWEVETLFRDFYREPLSPESMADLTRRTEGWAAGLQLFYLAVRGKLPAERRRILLDLGGSRSKLVREYLARNVLDELPGLLRGFLIGTSVLSRLSGPLCDELLDRHDSEAVLEELERNRLFTSTLEDGAYRYHEVLRSHLEAMLVEEVGEEGARARFCHAGELLEKDGDLPGALRAYCRAEDWDAAARLLGDAGERLAAGPVAWVERIPMALLRYDPWLMLLTARHHRAHGRWQEAIDWYGKAEATFGLTAAAATCVRERLALQAWLDPLSVPPAEWWAAIQAACAREPLSQAAASDDLPVYGSLVAGVSLLLCGLTAPAAERFRDVAEDPNASPVLAAGALLGAAVAEAVAGRATPGDLERAAEACDRTGAVYLGRLGRAAKALTGTEVGRHQAASLRELAQRDADPWGSSLASLLEGWGSLHAGLPAHEVLSAATAGFRKLGAGSLEGWSAAALALDRALRREPGAYDAARQAEAFTRAVAVRGPQALCDLALSLADPDRAGEHRARAKAMAEECGVALPPVDGGEGPAPAVVSSADASPPLEIACFGEFSVSVGGRAVPLSTLKPRARAVLRFLALHAGRPVHREVLGEALWPDSDSETVTRNLHVAVSQVRQVLEPGVERGAWSLLVRAGDAYRLSLPTGARVDLLELEEHLEEARAALARHDTAGSARSFWAALDRCRGDLLPEDGPVDWAVAARAHCQTALVDVASGLAEALLAEGEARDAMRACDAGLRIDRYADVLWRTLVDAAEAAGDTAAAARARHAYEEVLAALGVESA